MAGHKIVTVFLRILGACLILLALWLIFGGLLTQRNFRASAIFVVFSIPAAAIFPVGLRLLLQRKISYFLIFFRFLSICYLGTGLSVLMLSGNIIKFFAFGGTLSLLASISLARHQKKKLLAIAQAQPSEASTETSNFPDK